MKHIKLFEEFVDESIKFKDLVDKKFDIVVGSGTTNTTWNDNDLTQEIENAIIHNLFDADFSANWTDDGKEYLKVFKKDTLNPLLKNIDKTLKDLFTFKDNKLTFNITGNNAEAWIDKWFKTNKSISNSLRKDYYDYREEYAGVELK